MKKTTCFLLAITLFVAFFASACNGNGGGVDTQPTPNQPTPTSVPVQPTFASACPADPPCAAPAIKDTDPTDTYCVRKIPYQNFSVEPGTTFELIDPAGDLKCEDSGVVDNKGLNVWTCTGKQLWRYELKITNPACISRILETNTDRCQVGLGYDLERNCCAPFASGDPGSVTIKVNMGTCPIPSP